MDSLPRPLEQIIQLFESLPDQEKRENLVLQSESIGRIAPKPDESFDLQDIRKDEECADTVGVFLRVDPDGHATFRLTVGPNVQTLTKAMAVILCKGLTGATCQQVLDVPADFVPRIVGGELVRLRSQTTYYVLSRMKAICKVYLDRQRALS